VTGRRWLDVCLLALAAAATTAPAVRAQAARAVRVRGAPPAIDGRLDEAVWRSAPALTALRQREPVEGAAPSESSAVRFLYDDDALYVGFRGYDDDPADIVSRLVRRDERVSADYFAISLDSYGDGRSAFEFGLNPSGARRDVFIYNDGGGRDPSWDPVYEWATRVDSLGWTVELRIPFSQLRFPSRDSVVFGLRVRRTIPRLHEEDNWPFIPRDLVGEVSHYGHLAGLVGVPSRRRVELLPYTAGSTTLEPAEDGNPFVTGQQERLRGGTNLKLGVTSALTLDFTANPDFGQVEADPAVVNLTAFESFFPEKRPFFVEGVNLFQLGLEAPEVARGDQGPGGRFGGEEGLVYTRRIGRTPHIDPEVDGGYVDRLKPTSIIGAGKLSGQLPGGWSLGLLQAVTGRESVRFVDSTGTAGTTPVEPTTSYSVVRMEHNGDGGRLAYGAIATSVVRELQGAEAFQTLASRAFTAGSDLRWRSPLDGYEVVAGLMGSRIAGSAEAILETQESSAHYFQRPDQTYARLDAGRTSLTGYATYARAAKVTGFVNWQLRYEARSPGFEANDIGYMRRADDQSFHGEWSLRWLTPGRVFRRFEWRTTGETSLSYGWERRRTQVSSRVSMDFPNYWGVNASVERTLASLSTRLLRGGPAFAEPGAWQLRGHVRSDYRSIVSGDIGAEYQVEDVTGAVQQNVNAGIRLRPEGPLTLSVDAQLQREANDRQYVAADTVTDSTYYLFGHLDRREASITFRLGLALTPRLSLDVYAEPFVSTARYTGLKLVADPRAAAYADRFDMLGPDRLTRPGGDSAATVDVNRDGVPDFSFDEPDFRVVSLRTNTVLRWEFLPGSTLFVVWQQNREDDTPDAAGGLGRGFLDTFAATGQHVFAVKVAYWLGL
jgi:hypothetical protein